MTKSVLLLLILAIAAALPAAPATITIDFDNVLAGPLLPTALSSYGIDSVTSSAGSIPAAVYRCNAGCSDILPASSHSFLATAGGSFPAPTGIFTTTLIFHDPTPYFSFYKAGYSVNTVGVAGWEVDAYDAGNQLVDSVSDGFAAGLDYPPSPTPVQYLLQGPPDITEVVFRVNYNYQSTTGNLQTDLFQFQTAPEPAAFILAGSGLALAFALSRRSRRI